MMRSLMTLAAAVFLTVSSAALAADEIGVPVTIIVRDPDGNAVPTAVVRHALVAERQRVNAVTGEWMERVLYLQDGSEFIFEKGVILEVEVSAPGYKTRPIKYEIRKRKNIVPIVLEPLEIEEDQEEEVEPVIQFGRDKPID